ncbi:MAG: hypothetical protein ACTSYB_14485 [Candidatus Helarchaeota archaeon]
MLKRELSLNATLHSEISTLKAQLSVDKEQIIQVQNAIEDAEAGIISKAIPNFVKGDTQAAEKIAQIAQKIKSNLMPFSLSQSLKQFPPSYPSKISDSPLYPSKISDFPHASGS